MKKLILAAAIFLSFWSNATTYYVSSSIGNDGRSSVEAQNPNTPWKTIDKVNSIFSILNGGDAILFRRDDVFYGRLIIGKSGDLGNPITIGAYGSGALPVITSFNAISSWNNVGGNIWESTNAVTTKSYNNIVVVNQNLVAMGRFPNNTYIQYQSSSANPQPPVAFITSSGLSASPNWTGAEAVIKKTRWIIDRSPITSHSGNTINYTTVSPYQPIPLYGFFIQNDIKTLDLQGEWFFNPASKKISIYSSSTPTNVQVPTFDTVVTLVAKNNIILENLNISGANKTGLLIGNCDNLTVRNCTIEYCFNAVLGENTSNISPNFTLESCTIRNITNQGCYLPSDFNGCIIKNNNFLNIGLVPGMGGSGDGAYLGISLEFVNNFVVRDNKFENIGSNGIAFLGKNNLVTQNYVHNACTVKDDGGGIYTYSPTGTDDNSIISKNIIDNVPGNGEGTRDPDFPESYGIFIDRPGVGIQIIDNSITSAGGAAIFLHGSKNITVTNNTTFNSLKTGMYIVDRTNGSSGLTITNNRFIAKDADETVVKTELHGSTSWGILDYNTYGRPIDNDKIFFNEEGYLLFNFPQWKSFLGQDQHSQLSPRTVTNINQLRFVYNETSVNKVINLGAVYIDLDGNPYNGSITLSPFTSRILIEIGAVLPVTLVNFTAVKQGAKSQLNWVTSQEINTKEFVLERSVDGSAWLPIAVISANGNSNAPINYNYLDINPAKGLNLYRLKIVDVDLRFQYSSIRKVNFEGKYTISLFPNPVHNYLTIYADDVTALQADVQIINSHGQIVWHQNKQVASATLQIDLQTLQAGVYTVRIIKAPKEIFTQQFIKQ